MSALLLDEARKARDKPAVLKMLLSNIRSKNRHVPVLVFEGDTDVGPYEVWISRLATLQYHPLIAKGKQRTLEFRLHLQEDQTGVAAGVFFLVDRDYDDLGGHQPGEDLFCTQAYSIESYLATSRVFESILVDELKCVAELSGREKALALFRQMRDMFLSRMREANLRLFVGRRLNLKSTGVSERIADYVDISIDKVQIEPTRDLSKVIPLDREPSPDEIRALEPEFSALDPATRHRGKYLLSFFFRWLELFSKEREKNHLGFFDVPRKVGFSSQQLSLRSLATRSEIPEGLENFLATIQARKPTN